ncbi:MAG: esterase family protein, partial [Tannerella sp.]|nr:esterase family protein [Tannerella sp.]
MTGKGRLAGVFLFTFLAANVFAGQVDTVAVYSPSMNSWVKNTVIVPADTGMREAFPVVYLLHGYGGDHRSWIRIHPGLPELATRYGVIIVCPDGQNSWYWDSPAVPA